MLRLTRHPRFTTDDLEELKESVRHLLDRNVELIVSDDPFHFTVHTATMELLTVSALEVSEGITARETHTGYSLVRVELGNVERRYGGLDHAYGPGTGYCATPDRKAQTILPYSGIGTVVSVTIELPDALVRSQAEALIGEPVTQPLIVSGPLNLGRFTYLGQSIDHILEELDRDDGLFTKYPLIGQRHQRELVRALIERTQNNYLPLLARIHGGPARRHVAMMEELIEANIKCPPTIADLARLIGVSARTLYENCRHVRGLRPEDIIRKLRLHAVRKRLENPQRNDLVTTVANEYAFANIKYFADVYQQQFHERPTETLHRARRRLVIALGAALGS